MSITQAICNSFREELATGIHDLSGDTLKLALYTESATLGATTTAYSATNEVSGTNYTAGGETVTGASLTTDGSVSYVDFDDVTWGGLTASNVRGALLYNSSKSNRAICVFKFPSTQSYTGTNFTVELPAAGVATAVLRIS